LSADNKRSGQEVSYPFVNLPSRKLVDYFALIKHPVSLRALEKMVKGVQGRNEPTGVSLFKSWKEFEDEVSYIWKNARQYNEDGSEITELARQLEVSLHCSFLTKCFSNAIVRCFSSGGYQKQRGLFPSLLISMETARVRSAYDSRFLRNPPNQRSR
jgi:hypothetical protein